MAAQKTVRLTTVLQSNALVMEPCYAVTRAQIFCLPVDVVGQPDSAQLVVLELKGKIEDFSIADYAPLTEGFSCMCFHRFEEAEARLQQCEGMDHTAVRLLQLVRLFMRVQALLGQRTFLSKPYYRQMPVWDSHEVKAERYEIDPSVTEALAAMHVRMPATHFRRMRLPSIQPEMFLRNKIDHDGGDEDGDGGGGGEHLFFGSGAGAAFATHGGLSASMEGGAFGHGPMGSCPGSMDVGVFGDSLRAGSPAFALPDPFNTTAAEPMSPLQQSGHASPSFPFLHTQPAQPPPPVEPDSLSEFSDHKNEKWMRSERQLGRGSFGTVFLGMAAKGSLVAMKLLPILESSAFASPAKMNQVIDEVLKEVALLSTFESEYVVRYLSCAFVQRNIIVIMEYVGGGSLSSIVGMFGGLSLPIVRRFAKDVVQGLAFLHTRNVVHRDINPNNVLLTIDGLCKLSDFGASTTSLRQQQGQGGGIHGTPIFMAPEACRGEASKASDVWSFGILLCYMVSGGYPYPVEDMEPLEGFMRRIGEDAAYLPTIPRNCNAQIEDLMRQCLQREAAKRPSAQELTRHAFFLT